MEEGGCIAVTMQTIDLDCHELRSLHKTIDEILQRILKCHHIGEVWVRESASKNGYHIKILCDVDCELCRLAFDDQVRFTADYINKKQHNRNVLFTIKYYKKGGKTIQLKSGEWRKYNIKRLGERRFGQFKK